MQCKCRNLDFELFTLHNIAKTGREIGLTLQVLLDAFGKASKLRPKIESESHDLFLFVNSVFLLLLNINFIMLKCKTCGKFLAANDTVKCKTCPTYHCICVKLPVSGAISLTCTCPGCRAKLPHEDNSNIPVKGLEIVESASSVTATHPEGTLLEPKPKTKCLTQTGVYRPGKKKIRSLRKEVSALRSEIREFREEITGLKESVKLYGDRVELLEGRVTSIEYKFEHMELRNESWSPPASLIWRQPSRS